MGFSFAVFFTLYLFLVVTVITNKDIINEKARRNFWILAGLYGVWSVFRFVMA
ncbi:hypothetical protein P9X10_00405 [Bacillus cereus]|nr:hypothetical protein [Bacillus cereus]